MITINRKLSHFFLALASAAITLYPLIDKNLPFDSYQFGEYARIIATLIWLYIPVSWIVTYKYLQIDDNNITFKKSLFQILEFKADQVESITLEYSPFSSSYFSMDDGSKVKFDAWSIPEKDMDKLKLITPNIK